MKRKVISFLIILACFLLQSAVFPWITFFTVKPNLLIIVTASFGFMRGKKEGMQVGFICGILMDVFWGGLLGFYALIYTTADLRERLLSACFMMRILSSHWE